MKQVGELTAVCLPAKKTGKAPAFFHRCAVVWNYSRHQHYDCPWVKDIRYKQVEGLLAHFSGL